jgi:CRISPR system Cascade subunit CasC
MAIRSRRTFDAHIRKPLEEAGVSADLARAVTAELMKVVLGQSAKSQKASKEDDEPAQVESGQVTVVGPAELRYLLAQAKEMTEGADQVEGKKAIKFAAEAVKERKKEWKANLQAMRLGAGLDAALFGRMVTSDILAQTDAAIHVAHAFTVHGQQSESDYFSAIDDLVKDAGEAGSGHIGSTELTSGLFYGYVVVDLPLLVSNLEACEREEWEAADRGLAAEVVKRLVHLIATVSPGAKLGSTAPYSWAHFIAVEHGSAQPRTLANAFLDAVSTKGDLVSDTNERVVSHLAQLDSMYGRDSSRRVATLGEFAGLEQAFDERSTVSALAEWAGACVRGEG